VDKDIDEYNTQHIQVIKDMNRDRTLTSVPKLELN